MSKDVKVERNWSPGLIEWITGGIRTTKVTDRAGNTYTGHGWTSEESDKNAGQKMQRGDKDKK